MSFFGRLTVYLSDLSDPVTVIAFAYIVLRSVWIHKQTKKHNTNILKRTSNISIAPINIHVQVAKVRNEAQLSRRYIQPKTTLQSML